MARVPTTSHQDRDASDDSVEDVLLFDGNDDDLLPMIDGDDDVDDDQSIDSDVAGRLNRLGAWGT